MSRGACLLIAGATGYGVWPANSLEGLEGCLRTPVDGVEIDVGLTGDGRVVAHHDLGLDPDQTRRNGRWLTEPGPPPKSLLLEDLADIDVGRTRPGSPLAARHPQRPQRDGARIPTLEAVLTALKAADGPPRRLYVELKTDPSDAALSPDVESLVQAVILDLQAAEYLEKAKIIAFDWRVLRLTRIGAPSLALGHLVIPPGLRARVRRTTQGRSPWHDGCDPLDHRGSELAALKGHGGVEWSPHFIEVTAETAKEARDLDLLVGAWGVSKGEDIARMRSLGASSLTLCGPDWG